MDVFVIIPHLQIIFKLYQQVVQYSVPESGTDIYPEYGWCVPGGLRILSKDLPVRKMAAHRQHEVAVMFTYLSVKGRNP